MIIEKIAIAICILSISTFFHVIKELFVSDVSHKINVLFNDRVIPIKKLYSFDFPIFERVVSGC